MSKSQLQNMQHIETVRNFLDSAAWDLINRGRFHDRSKLRSPEVEIFEEYTPKLKNCTYGSDEYKTYLSEMKVALDHHYSCNRHHPEHFEKGISEMNLIDLIEMLLDWKAASLRHADGDIYKSIEMNQERFGYSDEMKNLLFSTMKYFDNRLPFFEG